MYCGVPQFDRNIISDALLAFLATRVQFQIMSIDVFTARYLVVYIAGYIPCKLRGELIDSLHDMMA